MNPKGFFSNYE